MAESHPASSRKPTALREDARRQRSTAEDAAIAATRDRVQARIALMKAIGVVTPPLQDSDGP